MALNTQIDQTAYEALPEQVREHYNESSENKGTFLLDVKGEIAGMVPKEKLGEFRDNNTRLLKEVKDLKNEKERIEGQLKELREKTKNVGDVDELVETKIKQYREDMEAQKKKLETDLADVNGRLERELIDNRLMSIGTELKVQKDAMPDFVSRGRSVFKIKDGDVVALNGENVLLGKDGSTPLSMQEWGTTLREKASHLFEGSSGSGAGGSGTGSGGTDKDNPFNVPKGQSPNLTKVHALAAEDMSKAVQLCKEAGFEPSAYGLTE